MRTPIIVGWATVAAAGVQATAQTAAGPVPHDIPTLLIQLSQWAIVGMVGVIFWFLRQMMTHHDRRLTTLEQQMRADVERIDSARGRVVKELQDAIHTLEVAVARLETVCPYLTHPRTERHK